MRRYERQTKVKPDIPHHIFCKGCFTYETRELRAKCERAMTGEAGIWDFAVCYDSCIKGNQKWGSSRGREIFNEPEEPKKKPDIIDIMWDLVDKI